MPQILLWNLKYHDGFPISVNDMHSYENVLLMSGFNENNLKIFQKSSENSSNNRTVKDVSATDNILFKLLSNKRYDFVNKEILANILL